MTNQGFRIECCKYFRQGPSGRTGDDACPGPMHLLKMRLSNFTLVRSGVVRFLLGIGDSHLKSLTAAWQEFEALNPGMIQYTTISARNKDLAPWFLSQNGIDSPNPLWVSAIRCALRGADALVVLCLAGNRDWAWGLTAGPNPFDFIDPDNDIDTEPMGQLIPYDLFMTKARSEYGAIRMVANTVRQVRRRARGTRCAPAADSPPRGDVRRPA